MNKIRENRSVLPKAAGRSIISGKAVDMQSMGERVSDMPIMNEQAGDMRSMDERVKDMQATDENMRAAANMSRQQLLKRINEVSFAINDMQLYLDTHPDSRRGLRFMEEHQEERRRLLDMYARRFGPLTMDSANMSDEDSWKWMEQPFPWQQEGGCR